MDKTEEKAATMTGTAFLFSETGTEGGWWTINGDGFLHKDGSVLWHGIIHQDTSTGLGAVSASAVQVRLSGKTDSHPI